VLWFKCTGFKYTDLIVLRLVIEAWIISANMCVLTFSKLVNCYMTCYL